MPGPKFTGVSQPIFRRHIARRGDHRHPGPQGLLRRLVAGAYSWAKALNAGTVFEVDDVVDPADTRKWLVMGLNSVPPKPLRDGKKRAWVDTW